jgi:hypothetical protein
MAGLTRSVARMRLAQQRAINNGLNENAYQYSFNNPVAFVDPTGNGPMPLFINPSPIPVIPCDPIDLAECELMCLFNGGVQSCTMVTFWYGICTCNGTAAPPLPPLPPVPPRCPPTQKTCPPCPPNQVQVDQVPPGRPHGPWPGTHWHCLKYNQNPDTCVCYPQRVFGGCIPPPAPATC